MICDFAGKVAVVTGAASGIGEAIAQQLAAEGARVVVADRDAHGAGRVVAEIIGAGGRAVAFEVNVADAIEIEAMVSFAVKTYGDLHLSVNNAGISGPSAMTADYPLYGWKQVIDVNLNSVFYGLKYQIPAIISSGGGAIVNMASILGTLGFAQAAAYTTANMPATAFGSTPLVPVLSIRRFCPKALTRGRRNTLQACIPSASSVVLRKRRRLPVSCYGKPLRSSPEAINWSTAHTRRSRKNLRLGPRTIRPRGLFHTM